MKTVLFLSVGLALALTASASPPTLAVEQLPDGNFNNVFENSSTGAASTNDIAFVAVGDQANVFSISSYALIDEAVPEQSDHPVAMSNDVVKYLVIDEGSTVATVNGNLLNSDVNISALAAVGDRQRPCNCAIMNGYSTLDLDLENSTGLAAITATASGNLRHSVAWVTSYLSGSESRL